VAPLRRSSRGPSGPLVTTALIRNDTTPGSHLGRPGVVVRSGGTAVSGTQLKESPQAQEPVAFGLSIVKPCFSIVSTKSITAPPR
jgi:hypothetical protein